MKVWTKVHIKDENKQVKLISRAFTNYLYAYGPSMSISKKYNISQEDMKNFNQYTANRVAGLLMLYLSKNFDRINDIANKYNVDILKYDDIVPEIEGYIERK